MRHGRRALLASIGAGSIATLAGCTDGGEEADVNVGMVYATGGLGDQSFNDLALDGVEQAQDDYGIGFQNTEPQEPADVDEFQRELASSTDPDFDLINTIGFVQVEALLQNAVDFPEQNWTLIDEIAEDEDGNLVDNVANYVFREHEGSFQVGVMAAMLTEREFGVSGGETNPDEQIVGFVGGVDVPIINRFEAGFRAGVNHVNDEIEVQSAYAGDFDVPDQGQAIAQGMYDDGADIVYHGAGGTGLGVFEAAQSSGRYAIGVDNDQSLSAPEFSDVIIASMVKRVNTAVYESVESIVNDEFEGGVVNDLGLEEDGVGTVVGQDFEDDIPDEVLNEVDSTRQAIIDGDITVPESLDEV